MIPGPPWRNKGGTLIVGATEPGLLGPFGIGWTHDEADHPTTQVPSVSGTEKEGASGGRGE